MCIFMYTYIYIYIHLCVYFCIQVYLHIYQQLFPETRSLILALTFETLFLCVEWRLARFEKELFIQWRALYQNAISAVQNKRACFTNSKFLDYVLESSFTKHNLRTLQTRFSDCAYRVLEQSFLFDKHDSNSKLSYYVTIQLNSKVVFISSNCFNQIGNI